MLASHSIALTSDGVLWVKINPTKLLPYEAYYKYYSMNRLMRYLVMSLVLLKSYKLVGEGFRFDAFEPVRTC